MAIKLSELLSLYKESQVDSFLLDKFSLNLKERKITEETIKNLWTPVGGNFNNASTIDLLADGDKGIIERLTNCIDTVLERKVNELNISGRQKTDYVLKKAFPKYMNNVERVFSGEATSCYSYDASDYVVFAANLGSDSSKPTFDIVDRGLGIEGSRFSKTILSLQADNKAKVDKNFTIGSFGQGGSTSIPSANTTIIISKKNGKYFYTIVRCTQIDQRKNHTYLYLTPNGEIDVAEDDHEDVVNCDYLNSLFEDESGTIIRMIDTEISKEFRDKALDKPMAMGDFLNTELFGVKFPIRLVENRENFLMNVHAQERYSYGSLLKLETWKYNKKEYSGHIDVEYKNELYKINFYVVLPNKEEDWGKDEECKKVFKMFNVHEKSLFFTVNGQYIEGIDYTRIRNKGLSSLEYRLLINIELDDFGADKFNFFTTDRSKIKSKDVTNQFIDKVIKTLASNDKLIEINNKISELSKASTLGEGVNEAIGEALTDSYQDFSKEGDKKRKFTPHPDPEPRPTPEPIFKEQIEFLKLTNTKKTIYKDEKLKIVIKTGAYKHVNDKEKVNIFGYLDDESISPDSVSVMNGVVQYVYERLSVGEHVLKYAYFPKKQNAVMLESEEYIFEVIDEKMPEDNDYKNKHIDIKFEEVTGKETIITIIKNDDDKQITLQYDTKHPELERYYYGLDEAKINEKRLKFIIPSALCALYLKETYDNLDAEGKNKVILAYIASIFEGEKVMKKLKK